MERYLIEFFVDGAHELWMRDNKGEQRKFLNGETDIVRRINGIIAKVYPDVYEALANHYSKYKRNKMYYEYKIAARFVRCNMSEDDMGKFDLEGDKLNIEQSRCPLKGSGDCPFENVVCNPKPTGLTEKETEVVRLYARGRSVSDIALLLGKSFETVKHQLWRVKKRFGLESTRDIIVLAYFLNVV